MSQPDLAQLSPEEMNRRLWRGFGKFIDRITPALYELGAWLFGSLIAFNLLILAALFTVGPVDAAIKAGTTATALALPLNVTGLVLLRLVQELKGVSAEDQLMQAFQEAGFASDQLPARQELEATLGNMRSRRTAVVLRSSAGILASSVLLTLIGLMSTLWHMAWWIAASFLGMIALSITLAVLIMAASQPSDSPKSK